MNVVVWIIKVLLTSKIFKAGLRPVPLHCEHIEDSEHLRRVRLELRFDSDIVKININGLLSLSELLPLRCKRPANGCCRRVKLICLVDLRHLSLRRL